MSILKSPLVTEKISALNEKGKYGFVVEGTANKVEIKNAVEKMLHDETYQNNIEKLSKEFSRYDPNELCASYINQVLEKPNKIKVF